MAYIISEAAEISLRELFSRNPRIIAVILFGSYNTPYYTDRSDLDFGVVYDGPVDLRDELELELDLSQILKTERIDLINLNRAPLMLKYNAVAQGRIIFERNYEKTSDFIEAVYRDYCDFEPEYRMLCAEYDRSLKESYGG